nr:hypothetical protein BaRGS_030047 [Batillaria attramentaria]
MDSLDADTDETLSDFLAYFESTCGFHVMAWRVVLDAGFLRVCPIQLHFLRRICLATGSCPARSHSSSFRIFSGHRMLKMRLRQPCLILFHMDRLPTGLYWDTLLRMVPNILHVRRLPPTVIFGRNVTVVEHQSDIARLEAIRKFGGMYFDTDYLIVNPLEDLRNHSAVLGVEIPGTNFANGVILGKAGAEFLDLWYESYHTFNDKQWAQHSTILPYKLHKAHPNVSLHVVNTLVDPHYQDIKKKFYDNFFDWKSKHGIHLYVRMFNQYFEDNFETKNSSLGQVSRNILFGDSDVCFEGMTNAGELVGAEKVRTPEATLSRVQNET